MGYRVGFRHLPREPGYILALLACSEVYANMSSGLFLALLT